MPIKRFISAVLCLALALLLLPSDGYPSTDSLLRLLSRSHNTARQIEIYNELARSLLLSDPKMAGLYLEKSMELSAKTNRREAYAEALLLSARIDMNASAHDSAMAKSLKALEIGKQVKKKVLQADAMNNIGNVYNYRHDYTHAMDYYLKAINIYEDYESRKKELAFLYNRIGGIYYDMFSYTEAHQYYTKSLQLYLLTGDQRGTAALYNNLGEIFRLQNDLNQALYFYSKALDISEEQKLTDIVSVITGNIGQIYLSLGNYDEAAQYLRKSLKVGQEINDFGKIASASLGLGDYFFTYQRYIDSAEMYYTMAIKFANEEPNLLSLSKGYEGLSETNATRGNWADALRYHKLYQHLEDSLINAEKMNQITQMQMKFKFENEQKLNRAQRQKIEIIFAICAVGLFFFLIIIVLIYGRKRILNRYLKLESETILLEQKYLREEIDHKNRELTANVMYRVNKNETLARICDKLSKAKNNFQPLNQPAIQEIINVLKDQRNDNIWDEFNTHFKEVHQDFYTQLYALNPNLTPAEKKLCSLLRMNLTSKEIAIILKQTVGSVEIARTRLRKKLNIANTDVNLFSFLSQFG
jgi:tetratricopeptide (TPR) repeat protein